MQSTIFASRCGLCYPNVQSCVRVIQTKFVEFRSMSLWRDFVEISVKIWKKPEASLDGNSQKFRAREANLAVSNTKTTPSSENIDLYSLWKLHALWLNIYWVYWIRVLLWRHYLFALAWCWVLNWHIIPSSWRLKENKIKKLRLLWIKFGIWKYKIKLFSFCGERVKRWNPFYD